MTIRISVVVGATGGGTHALEHRLRCGARAWEVPTHTRAETDQVGPPLEGRNAASAAAPAEPFGFSQTGVSTKIQERFHLSGMRLSYDFLA